MRRLVRQPRSEANGELVQTTLPQPKPNPPKGPYVSFHEDFFDSVKHVCFRLARVGWIGPRETLPVGQQSAQRRSLFEAAHKIGTGDWLVVQFGTIGKLPALQAALPHKSEGFTLPVMMLNYDRSINPLRW